VSHTWGEDEEGGISRTLCASLLCYDVLGLVVCFQWGTFVFRGYGVIFGAIAEFHTALYIITCLLYASFVVLLTMRFIRKCFPSGEEVKDASPEHSEPFLELGDARPIARSDQCNVSGLDMPDWPCFFCQALISPLSRTRC
jgi:hypothetical protein